jgi:hypothetical protein
MLNYLAGWALSGHNSQGIYNQLSGLLARGDHPIITLGSGGSGHAVVAYDVEPGYKGNGDYYIDVYDPNLPFGSVSEQYSRIYIDPSSGWSYNPLGWSGGYGPSGMMVIPTSVLSGQLTMPASLSGLAKFAFGSADPETLKEAVGRTSV